MSEFIGQSCQRESGAAITFEHWTWSATNMAVEPHGHERAHFMIILDGEFESEARGEGPPALKPVIFNPPQTFHADRFRSDRAQFLSISLSPSVVEPSDQNRIPSHPRVVPSLRVRKLIASIMAEMAAWDAGSAGIAEALALEMLWEAGLDTALERERPQWLVRLADQLREDTADLSVTAMAREVGVHPVHLARTFRRFFGTTPGEFRRRRRAERCAGLLLGRPVSLADIAIAAGYADQPHMTSQFRKAFGLTPGSFRKLALSA